MSTLRTAVFTATALLLAACDAPRDGEATLDPAVAQHLAAARADPDAELAERVKSALGAEAGRSGYPIEATAAEGIVDLWGKVDSNSVRKRLEVTAAGVVGVKALRDHIQVDPGA